MYFFHSWILIPLFSQTDVLAAEAAKSKVASSCLNSATVTTVCIHALFCSYESHDKNKDLISAPVYFLHGMKWD